MNNKVVGIVSGVIIAAGTTGVLLSNRSVPVVDPPAVVVPKVTTEAENAGSAIKTDTGKLIHIFGVRNDKSALVIDSLHGRTAVFTDVPETATCNVLVDAKTVPPLQKTTNKLVNGKPVAVSAFAPELPEIPKLTNYFGTVSWPVRIPDSCTKEGKCLWEILLRGDACKTIGEDPSFVSSSPREFSTLSKELRERAKTLPSWSEKE